jgi:squalene-hopene/tetraprenyl-beta-curcumene cyclase
MNQEKHNVHFAQLSAIIKSGLNDSGFWTGELSSSALATAVSIVALKLGDPQGSVDRIAAGFDWLVKNINDDGGFGDTPDSASNLSTTLLGYAAMRFCSSAGRQDSKIVVLIEQYLSNLGIDINSSDIVASVLGYYGKDYTFSLPILSMLVICEVLDEKALNQIPTLPFELTLLPSPLYRFFNLQVVSYAIPALVAVGIYLFKRKHKPGFVTGFVRKRSVDPALRKLQTIMPESGGFLEAIPLTAFVSMCLIRSGFDHHPVVDQGIGFLKKLQRADGSWPIDTDLSTWSTTLLMKAMDKQIDEILTREQVEGLRSYLLDNQYQQPHLFNHADPGGWGWSSFSGSVPDADDTAGAILALNGLKAGKEVHKAVLQGCFWLAGLQNRDGGIPTFCKGWGRLPFDRSCADLTGHALLAWVKSMDQLYGQGMEKEISKLKRPISGALRFLEKEQKKDGSWLPLWFGNQMTRDKTNPVYGTARVMVYLQDALECKSPDSVFRKKTEQMTIKAANFISDQQNSDGSWGAHRGIPGSIEETSLAISALVKTNPVRCDHGFDWLSRELETHGLQPKPIGLYFATLWYHEKLYPLAFYLEALRRRIFPR